MPRDTGRERRRRRRSTSSSDSESSGVRRREKRRRDRKNTGWGVLTAPAGSHPITASAAAASTPSQVSAGMPVSTGTRIYIGSISYDAREEDVMSAFSKFGTVVSCTLSDDTVRGHHMGYCFVDFASKSGAEAALKAPADSILLRGRPCRVGMPSSMTDGAVPGMAVPANPMAGTTIGREEEIKINGATARAEVMRRLAASKGMHELSHKITLPGAAGGAAAASVVKEKKKKDPSAWVNPLLVDSPPRNAGGAPPAAPAAQAQPLPPTERPVGYSEAPSTVMCIINMVTDVDSADDELAAEVKMECSKHGTVTNLLIYDEKQPNGVVLVKLFVQFSTSIESVKCISVMNGRFFDGRRLQAFPFSEALFRQIQDSPD